MELLKLLDNEIFIKLVLAIIAAFSSLIVKYLRELSVSISAMAKELSSLNKEMAVIVMRVQTHEKRLDQIEDHLHK